VQHDKDEPAGAASKESESKTIVPAVWHSPLGKRQTRTRDPISSRERRDSRTISQTNSIALPVFDALVTFDGS
jgi:hypothetical protein